MEKIFINPRRSKLQKFINEAIEETNKGQRARTLGQVTAPDWRKHGKSGAFYWDGGGVSFSYGYGAKTSALAIAWWTDGKGNRHVRVVASRTYANAGAYGQTDTVELCFAGWEGVYPRRAQKKADLEWKRKQQRLERRGKLGGDDRFSLLSWQISAASKEGLLICDKKNNPRVVQVVVTCPSTGCRHHIGVPPRFANPKSKTYQDLGSEADRVHAAIAWTFGLKPEAYQPQLQS